MSGLECLDSVFFLNHCVGIDWDICLCTMANTKGIFFGVKSVLEDLDHLSD